MIKPICVKCGLFFRPEKNGFMIEEGKPYVAEKNEVVRYHGVNPGCLEADEWSGYKLWQGDKWQCRGCGVEIVVGFANKPWAEHYQENYNSERERLGGDNILFVHDC